LIDKPKRKLDEEERKWNNRKSRYSKQMKSLKRKGCIKYEINKPSKEGLPRPSIDYVLTSKGYSILKKRLI